MMKEQECQKLRMALDAVLDKIGPAFKHLVYEELEKSGISFEHPCSSLEDVQKALELTFGSDGALLLIQAVRRELAK